MPTYIICSLKVQQLTHEKEVLVNKEVELTKQLEELKEEMKNLPKKEQLTKYVSQEEEKNVWAIVIHVYYVQSWVITYWEVEFIHCYSTVVGQYN